MITSTIRRAAGAAAAMLALSAGAAAAHSQTVDPNGSGDGFVNRPISRPWAMAHCQAASPLLVADASGGVVQFNPARAFDNCVPGTRGNGD